MTDQPTPRSSRRTTVMIVVVLVVVIAAVAVIGLLAANGAPSASPTTSAPSSAESSSSTSTTRSATASSSPSATSKATKPTAPTSAPTPQATKTTSLSSSAPIAKELTATVTKKEAVQGTAQGPGEIAGPAVRFTITITNSTGKTVNLSNTVVNAYYGKQSTPAVELQAPGGDPFPQSVGNGKTAHGVFVFTIPKNQRSTVLVTVDTSVSNPVVAFRGSAPQ